MSERIKEKIGVYKEVYRSLFNLFIVTISGSFALFLKGRGNALALMGFGISVWLAIVLILLWRYMVNLVEEMENNGTSDRGS
jgi:hypothetical protein